MLFRTNYLVLVGGGKEPKWPLNKVILWDDMKQRAVTELEFRSEVLGVRLRRDSLIVVLLNKVFVYSLSAQPKVLLVVETGNNRRGLCCVSSMRDATPWMIVPGRQPGHVQVVDLTLTLARVRVKSTTVQATASTESRRTSMTSLEHRASIENADLHENVYGTSPGDSSKTTFIPSQTSIIAAHTTSLACMSISDDGSLLATASDKGTLIRVFDISSGRLRNELRRGADRAEIFSMAFSLSIHGDPRRLVVASDKGTVHVFNLDETPSMDSSSVDKLARPDTSGSNGSNPITETASLGSNRTSSLSFIGNLLPKYFSSEWSFAHARLPGTLSMEAAASGTSSLGRTSTLEDTRPRCIVGWSPNQSNAFLGNSLFFMHN